MWSRTEAALSDWEYLSSGLISGIDVTQAFERVAAALCTRKISPLRFEHSEQWASILDSDCGSSQRFSSILLGYSLGWNTEDMDRR